MGDFATYFSGGLSCKLYGFSRHFRSFNKTGLFFHPYEGINKIFLVLPPHTRDKEVHWDQHTFYVSPAAGP